VDGAAVTVFDLDGEVVRTADTGRDGYVTIRGLPTEVQLEAAAEGHIPTTRKVFGTSGGTEELTITLPFANRVLTGIVVNRLRTGLPGFTVEAQLTAKNASQMLTAVSGSDGRFEMQGAGEGLYQLRVLLGDEVRARSADVSPGKPVTIVVEDESPLRDETGLPTLSAPAGVTNLAAPPLEEPSGGGGLVLVQPPELPYGSTGMDSLPPASGVPPLSEGGFDSLYVTQPVGIGSLPISLKDKGGAVVVTAVGIGSQVAETGLKAGAILKKVDGAPVSSAAAAKKALSGRIGSVVLIEVLQEDTPLSLVVQRVP